MTFRPFCLSMSNANTKHIQISFSAKFKFHISNLCTIIGLTEDASLIERRTQSSAIISVQRTANYEGETP